MLVDAITARHLGRSRIVGLRSVRDARSQTHGPSPRVHGFLRAVRLEREGVPSFDVYPFAIPAVRAIDELPLDAKLTFFVGENGSGKSTLLEAIAVAAGFNPEGGSKNFNFATRESLDTALPSRRSPPSIR